MSYNSNLFNDVDHDEQECPEYNMATYILHLLIFGCRIWYFEIDKLYVT